MIGIFWYKLDDLTIFQEQGKYTTISNEFFDFIGTVFQW